jgi:hypothetical protein
VERGNREAVKRVLVSRRRGRAKRGKGERRSLGIVRFAGPQRRLNGRLRSAHLPSAPLHASPRRTGESERASSVTRVAHATHNLLHPSSTSPITLWTRALTIFSLQRCALCPADSCVRGGEIPVNMRLSVTDTRDYLLARPEVSSSRTSDTDVRAGIDGRTNHLARGKHEE